MLDASPIIRGNPMSPAPFLSSAVLHGCMVLVVLSLRFPEKATRVPLEVMPLYVPAQTPTVAMRPALPVRPAAKLFAPTHTPLLRNPAPATVLLLSPPEPVPSPAREPALRPPLPVPGPEVPPSIRPSEPVKVAGFGAAGATVRTHPADTPLIQIGTLEGARTELKAQDRRAPVASAGFGAAASDGPARGRTSPTPSIGGFGESTAGHGEVAPRRTAAQEAGAFGAVEAAKVRPAALPQVAKSQFETISPSPASPVTRTQPAYGRSSSLEILDKPRPAYSDEARRLHIEGEVVLEASFSASGQVRVLQVLRGLGHGLDENATKAALAIRFRPAVEHGVSVDSVATVRIEFQLAY